MTSNMITNEALAALRARVGLPAHYTEREDATFFPEDREGFGEGSEGSVFTAGPALAVGEHISLAVEASVWTDADGDHVVLAIRFADLDIDSGPCQSFDDAIDSIEEKVAARMYPGLGFRP